MHWLGLPKEQPWRAAISRATRSSLGSWRISLHSSANHYEEWNWKTCTSLCTFPVMWANACYIITFFFFLTNLSSFCLWPQKHNLVFSDRWCQFHLKQRACNYPRQWEERGISGLRNIKMLKMLGYLHSEHEMTSAILLIQQSSHHATMTQQWGLDA